MKNLSVLLILTLLVVLSCTNKRPGKPRVLIFSKTAAFVHASIPKGIAAIQKLGVENNFDVDTTKDASAFNKENLSKYAAVIFLSTTGNVLDYRQEAAFEQFIQAGGGFVGVHGATDTEYDWGWYGRLVGAYFISHPRPQAAKFIIKDKNFIATKFFTDTLWQRTDELYNFKKINPDIHVLVTIDESSYEGGANGKVHPMSWYHDYDGGRAFYTALGHTDESYQEENYLKHLLGGIQYAMGENLELDFSKARAQTPPDEDRFIKTQLALAGEFYEPTEMTVLPNLDILIVQRRGQVLLYKNETKEMKVVGQLDVYHKASVPGVNAEEGLMGLAKDPNYAKNHWVYMYYSPADTTSINRLSRFTFENDKLDMTSEKAILDVKTQRQICCHTGGSITFGPDGLLYVSSGDNSTPFNEPRKKYVTSGYGPMNDIPGHQQYDARRSSSNANDLRGKILRIKVNENASYEIPEGNLFPKGTPQTRPEIYVMGTRNPYRISVDQKNSNLYWGEVGPDANVDSLETRGPRGYDELNQARKAGYFGWPLFIGNNFPYHAYNYETGESGPAFDPNKPINNSRNNTGLTELPALSAPFIWYPYGASSDFPQVGTGGRNAMAGPVYYKDMFPKATRLPDYYDGKLIFYEWIRGWIKAVSLQPNGDFDKMEPFFPGINSNSCIDMEIGPDGRLYLLEYGSGWFTKNSDAGLARIDFITGNRPPKVGSLKVEKASGVLPFTLNITVDAVDPEGDKVTYKWDLGNGETKETSVPELEYTYNTPGDYQIFVEAKDAAEAKSKSESLAVYAGNDRPEVSLEVTGGNHSFYLPGTPLSYKVSVRDPHDSSKIDSERLFVSADYVVGQLPTTGHQQTISGKALMESLDCKSCHKEKEKSIGPSYVDVSKKYAKDPQATNYIAQKIVSGGSGVWGETVMAAHPGISQNEALQIASWIGSLANPALVKKSLPSSGSYIPLAGQKPGSTLVLSASYTDRGGVNIKPLTGTGQMAIRSNRLTFNGTERTEGFVSISFGGGKFLMIPAKTGWFALDEIDLTGVKSMTISMGWQDAPSAGLEFEVRDGSPDGAVLGTGSMPVPKKGDRGGAARVVLKAKMTGDHNLYFVCKAGVPVQGAVNAVEFN